MNELGSLRTETGKIFELDPQLKQGQYCLQAATGPVHYKESYRDGEVWLDLDDTHAEEGMALNGAPCLVYPRLPNITRVFTDRLGYEIQSRSNPDHVARVELAAIDGVALTRIPEAGKLAATIKVHPHRVGLWKDLSGIKSPAELCLRWKITELGNADKDSHPFVFRETPEAFSVADLTRLTPEDREAAKVTIETIRTRIDDRSWYWDEIIPVGARLVDTDWLVASSGDDGYWAGTYTFNNNNNWLDWQQSFSRKIFARFQGIAIVPGSTIDSAIITFTAAFSNDTSCSGRIYFNDVVNASAPNSAADANGRGLTTNYASLSVPACTAGEQFTTGSLAAAVQEVVDIAGWASGNSLLALSNVPTGYDGFVSYEGSVVSCPKLTVTWTEPPMKRHAIGGPNVSWLSCSLRRRRQI